MDTSTPLGLLPLNALIARLGDIHDEAIEELVRRFRPFALNLAGAILCDADLAEDAVQEAFIVALTRLRDLHNPDAFPGWWRQIVRSQAHRILRKRREEPLNEAYDQACDGPSARSLLEVAEIRGKVRAALKALPPERRETAEMFYLREMSHESISQRLGIPTGTVKSRLNDARRRLRALLLGQLDEENKDDDR